MLYIKSLSVIALLSLCLQLNGAEVEQLTPENWDKYVPAGKEVDAIYGDYVLRNDVLTAIIAQPTPTRNANLTIREVGGCVLDLTRHDSNNDQLGCYYPTGQQFSFNNPQGVDIVLAEEGLSNEVEIHITSQKESDGTFARVIYSIGNGLSLIHI